MSDELDLTWAEGQIAAARVPVPVGRAVVELLRAFANLKFPNDEQRDQALDLFTSLARDEAVVEETEGVWKPAYVGYDLQVGQTIRVQKDAFSGGTGRVHNGRVGRITGKRSGDIIVRSTDGREPFLDAAHYPANKLEVRVA